jgi:hypothetical protein
MRNIVLLAMAVIDGAARYPIEGPILVSDETAEKLIEAQVAESADLEEEEAGDDLDQQTVDQLKATATAEEVNLEGKSKKAEIIAAIREHRAAAAAQE